MNKLARKKFYFILYSLIKLFKLILGSGDKIRVGKDYQATIPDLIPVYG